MPDKRASPRRIFISRAEVVWTNAGQEHKISAMIEDRSDSGMGIRVPKPLPVGTLITIIQHTETFCATVRRCIRDGHEFFIGVEFAKPGGQQGDSLESLQ